MKPSARIRRMMCLCYVEDALKVIDAIDTTEKIDPQRNSVKVLAAEKTLDRAAPRGCPRPRDGDRLPRAV